MTEKAIKTRRTAGTVKNTIRFNTPGGLPSSRVAIKKEWEKRTVRIQSRT
jgi:molybdopterin biosynthesis enzyme MoaB